MAGFVLTNYMSLGQQTDANTFVDTTGNTPGVPGAMSMSDAALLTVSKAGLLGPNGENFEIKVVYADQLNPLLQPVFEVMEASYELVLGEYRWVRQRTISSSNNGAAVTFQSGTNNLKMFGVTSHEQFERNRDLRILRFDTYIDSADFTHTGDINYQTTYQLPLIEPKTSTSSLHIDTLSYTEVTDPSDNDARVQVSLQYKNTFGSDVLFGVSTQIGYINLDGVGASTMYAPASTTAVFTQANLNASGRWEVSLAARVLEVANAYALRNLSARIIEVG